MGLGYWTRSNSELCLLGTRGHPKTEPNYYCPSCDYDLCVNCKKNLD